jgi:formylglycine-generating enzyme required for sulfatase activity
MSGSRYLNTFFALACFTPVLAAQSAVGLLNLQFVRVQPGEFTMGSELGEANERPQHRVRITKVFELGKYEVTQAQWEAVMKENPSQFRERDLPVDSVSWNSAHEFVTRLNAMDPAHHYRLPTEAEWEYAARSGTTGDFAGDLDAMGWYYSNSDSRTHTVGGKQPNAWGLYDMHGNVWEWCQDWYAANAYSTSAAADPQGPEDGATKVLRGGSWGSNAAFNRVSCRISFDPRSQNRYFGLRLVRESKSR